MLGNPLPCSSSWSIIAIPILRSLCFQFHVENKVLLKSGTLCYLRQKKNLSWILAWMTLFKHVQWMILHCLTESVTWLVSGCTSTVCLYVFCLNVIFHNWAGNNCKKSFLELSSFPLYFYSQPNECKYYIGYCGWNREN